MKQAVICIAPDVSEAEREVTTLREAGFATDDISVLWPDMAGAQELGYEHHTKAPEGATWGVLFGSLLGGIFAYLAVLRVFWTPWSLDLINAGPVLTGLSGMAVGGMAGFVCGFLTGLAFPEYEAKKYERKIRVGNTLVAVHTDSSDEVKLAEQALKKTAAFGIHHIEEIERCKPKFSNSTSDTTVKASTALVLLLTSTLISIGAASADETAPVSPAEKKDEQKATMPPDVTTPKVMEPAKDSDQKTAVQTRTECKTTSKEKCTKAKAARKTSSSSR